MGRANLIRCKYSAEFYIPATAIGPIPKPASLRIFMLNHQRIRVVYKLVIYSLMVIPK